MGSLWWTAAMFLTLTGALFYWGARLFEVESFYVDSSAILGLALIMVVGSQL